MSTETTDTITGLAAPKRAHWPSLALAQRLDATVSGANGIAYLVAAGPIGDLLGLAPSLLRGVGAFLLVFAACVWFAPRRAMPVIAAGNGLWAAGSILAAIAAWGSPTTAGTVWIVLQAIVVAGFAELQVAALRRSAG